MFDGVKAVLRWIAIAVAILLVLLTIALFADPVTEAELCSDHGGRWNDTRNACECTYEELRHPRVSKERIAYCETPLPGSGYPKPAETP
jgi:hypothetical protein